MTGDCQRFSDLVLDLVYGELDPARTGELKRHAAACPRCQEELDEIELTRKMTARLPLLQPTAEADRAVLERAVEVAADLSTEAARAVPAPMVEKATRPVIADGPGLLQRLRSLLLSPAFATAAVAVVVLVVSVFLVERSQPRSESGVTEEKAPFFGPAVPYEQAEPVAKAEGEAAGPSEAPSRPEVSLAPTPREAPASELTMPMATGVKRQSRDRRPALAEDHTLADLSSGAGAKGEAGDTLSGDARPRKRLPKKKKAASGSVKTPASPTGLASADSIRFADDEADLEPVEKERSALGASAKDGRDLDLQVGIDAYHRGDCDTAEPPFRRVVNSDFADSTQKALALHYLARCEKRRGRCGRAVPWYDKLLAGYPSYSGRPQALWEAAACHRDLGNTARARVVLEQLQRISGWESRARQELRRL